MNKEKEGLLILFVEFIKEITSKDLAVMVGGGELTYSYRISKTQRALHFLLFIWLVQAMFTNTEHPSMYYYFLAAFSIFNLVVIFINFKFKIIESSLTFQILLFTFTIYKKEIHHKHIDSMKFKRVGWAKKSVTVKSNKGLNLRVSNFYPKIIYNDLIAYAEEYSIPITKTKDYLILEKLN